MIERRYEGEPGERGLFDVSIEPTNPQAVELFQRTKFETYADEVRILNLERDFPHHTIVVRRPA